jgi:hypothetical protein
MEINNLQFLASFNWIESDDPTIAFPGKPEGRSENENQALTYPSGMPAVWDPPLETRRLPQDNVRCFRRKRRKTSEPSHGAGGESSNCTGPRPKD